MKKLMVLILSISLMHVVEAKTEAKKEVWGNNLTDMQHKVTRENGTEPPFKNEYWNNKRPGIYVDINTGEALFSSLDKYDSGTGWPSFTKGINDRSFSFLMDTGGFGEQRTEVKSIKGNSHLGHVFNDGPKDKGGKRFCINSAALKFIPLDKMEKAGYGEYLKLFDGQTSSKKSK